MDPMCGWSDNLERYSLFYKKQIPCPRLSGGSIVRAVQHRDMRRLISDTTTGLSRQNLLTPACIRQYELLLRQPPTKARVVARNKEKGEREIATV